MRIVYLLAVCFCIALSISLPCFCAEENEIAGSAKSFFEGYELYQKGYIRKAIPFFEQAIKENPKHAPTYSKLAECYEKLSDYRSAAPLWEKYLELRPRMESRTRAHVDLLQSMAKAEELLAQKTRDAETESKLDDLLWTISQDKYPGSRIAESAIVSLLPRLAEKEEFPKVLDLCKRIVKEYPDQLTAKMHFYWGQSLRGTGAFLDAIPVLEKAESMLNESPLEQKACRRELALSHMGLADRLLAAGKYLPARRAFEILRGKYFSALSAEESLAAQAMMMRCEAAQVGEWILTGDKYAKQNMFEDAIRWYEKVHTLTFSNTQTLQAEERIRAINAMADTKMAEVDQMVAQKQYRSAMGLSEAIEKAFPKKYRIKAMRKFADAAAAGGNFEPAANKLFAIAERYGDEEEGILAYAQVGYMYAMQAKDLQKGMSVFQAMSKWRASDERAQRESQLGVGIMLALMGKKEEATQILTAVAIKYKDNQRVAELCRTYIWKCKNCESIAL